MRSFSYVAKLSLCMSLSIFTVACQSDKETTKKDETFNTKTQAATNTSMVKVPSLRDVPKADGKALVQTAYLRERLNDSIFAYARIPNVWSFLGSPKGNVYDSAVDSKAFSEAAQSIKEGFNTNVIPDFPQESRLFVQLLSQSITSPIELAVLKGVDPAIPTPNVLLSAGVDFESSESIQTVLNAFAESSPQFEVSKAMNEEGYAEITISGMNGQIIWDKNLSRLFILGGVSLSPNNLSDFLKTLVANDTHQMLAVEKTIDESGQGVFAWANPRYLSETGNALGMQRQLAPLAMMGVGSMKNIAMGAGTSKGINRFKYVIEMPVMGFRSYMPIIKSNPTFNVSGKTDVVAVLGLPSKSEFLSIENTISLAARPKEMQAYYDGKKKFAKTLGFNLEDIFDFFGQDVSVVSGEAGLYFAVRLNNQVAFKKMLETSVKDFNLGYEQRTIAGHTYHHLKIPTINSDTFDEMMKNSRGNSRDKEGQKLLKRVLTSPTHLYWEQEGDYLIMAGIPQTLMDRHYVSPTRPVNEWLEKQQRIDSKGSLLMVTMRNEGSAEFIYRLQLGLLSYLGDIVERPVDLFALPSPREAKLPKEGALGAKITSSETQIAFELTYEHNPLEFLLAQRGYESIMAVGILSSIAVPAYQEYMIRAEIGSGLATAKSVTLELNEFEIENARYPNQAEIDRLNLNKKMPTHSISVEKDTGKVTVKFKHNNLRGLRNTLIMVPPTKGVSTRWTCESKIYRKYLPRECRRAY